MTFDAKPRPSRRVRTESSPFHWAPSRSAEWAPRRPAGPSGGRRGAWSILRQPASASSVKRPSPYFSARDQNLHHRRLDLEASLARCWRSYSSRSSAWRSSCISSLSGFGIWPAAQFHSLNRAPLLRPRRRDPAARTSCRHRTPGGLVPRCAGGGRRAPPPEPRRGTDGSRRP
jgi:hypothetical protein